MSAQLQFLIENQTIRRIDHFNVVGESHDYLRAEFSFKTHEWDSITKTAIFSTENHNYAVLIGMDNTCMVPWEVLQDAGYVGVSVFGGTLITSNIAKFFVEPSGYTSDIENAQEPTQELYEQVMSYLDDIKDTAISSAESASDSAESAKNSEESASNSADLAMQSQEIASASQEAASQYANEARGYSESASDSATTATNKADEASASAEAAVNAQTAIQSYADAAAQSASSAEEYKQSAKESADKAEEIRQSLSTIDGGSFNW